MARTMIRSNLLCAMIMAFAASTPQAAGQPGKREFVGTLGTLKIRTKPRKRA